MPKRELEHPIFDSSFKDRNDILGSSSEDYPKKCQKLFKKRSKTKQHLTLFSQPESLFLQFDPKKCNDCQSSNLEPTNIDYVCTQPTQKTEFRAGKESWQPPTNQIFYSSKSEVEDMNFNVSSHGKFPTDVINNINDQNECSEMVVSSDEDTELLHFSKCVADRINEENIVKINSNSDTLEKHLSDKEDDNFVSDVKPDKEVDTKEENNVFESMEVHEIDELIDKKIEDYLLAECELKESSSNIKNQQPSANKFDENTITSDESDDELKINKDKMNKLRENEIEILEEDEDKLLENSSPTIINTLNNYPSRNEESLKNGSAQNLNTKVEIFNDKEENEFDLTNSQFLQIEKEYTKSSEQGKFLDCSTQTIPIPELQNSMKNVVQMTGGLRKLKNDVQKIRQCVQELEKIDAVLVNARKEAFQRNKSQAWNSNAIKGHLPPRM